ncbi:MAG TPA: ABC transporter substrate-binding protein [bacterium]|nr:ABC transporter substrate-binding protein [bacterium]
MSASSRVGRGFGSLCRRLAGIAAVCVTVGVAVVAASTPPAVALRLAVVGGSPSFTAVWLGADSGIFEKYGVRVDLRTMNGSVALEALLAGDIEIAADGQTMVQADPTGARLAFVGALQNEFAGFVVYARPQIRSFAELRGQSVAGTTPAATATFAMRDALRKAGLDPAADVNWVYLGTPASQLAALEQGLIAAAVLPWPYNFTADREGLRALADLKAWHLPAAATTLAVRREWAAQNRSSLIAFLKGLIEATAVAKSDRGAAEEAIAKHLKLSDRTVVRASYARFADVWPNPPYITPAAVAEAIRDVPSPDAKRHAPVEFIDNSFLDEIIKSGFAQPFIKK